MRLLAILVLSLGVTLFGQEQVQPMAPSAMASSSLPGGSNLPSQKIRPNDLVGIAVFGEPDLTRTVRVDPEGMIRLPLLKDKIKAEGLMPEQLEKALADALKNEEILIDPFVTVTVAEYYRPLRQAISVVGAVRTPITFQSVETVTLLEAITRAGGGFAGGWPRDSDHAWTPARPGWQGHCDFGSRGCNIGSQHGISEACACEIACGCLRPNWRLDPNWG